MSGELDLASLLPTPTRATTAAREVLVRYGSAALVNHCERVYLWAASLGRLQRIAYDAELLYVASLLHDLGLIGAFDNHLTAFEEAGGDVSWVFGAGAGWPPARRDRVKEVIVRHMGDEVDPAADPEGHLLRAGTGLDVVGRDVDRWPEELRTAVIGRLPRLTLARELEAAFEDQARRKPGCAAAAAVASGMRDRLAANPLDGGAHPHPPMESAGPAPEAGSPYERVSVAAPPAVTVERLRAALAARGITEYAVVDHGHDMAAAGVPSHPAWTLVFGNPAGGEKLLARDLAAAVDIPLRLAVIGDGPDASTIVLRPMASLLPAELADVAEAFTGLLRALASAARDATTPDA